MRQRFCQGDRDADEDGQIYFVVKGSSVSITFEQIWNIEHSTIHNHIFIYMKRNWVGAGIYTFEQYIQDIVHLQAK